VAESVRTVLAAAVPEARERFFRSLQASLQDVGSRRDRAIALLRASGDLVPDELRPATVSMLRACEEAAPKASPALCDAEAVVGRGLPEDDRRALLDHFLSRVEGGALSDDSARPLFTYRSAVPPDGLAGVADRLLQALDSPQEPVVVEVLRALEDLSSVLTPPTIATAVPLVFRAKRSPDKGISKAAESAIPDLFRCLAAVDVGERVRVLQELLAILAEAPREYAFPILWAFHWNHDVFPTGFLPALVRSVLAVAEGADDRARDTLLHGLASIAEVLPPESLRELLAAAERMEPGMEREAAEWYADILDNPVAAEPAVRRLFALTRHPEHGGEAWSMLSSNAERVPVSCLASAEAALAKVAWARPTESSRDAAAVAMSLRRRVAAAEWSSAGWMWCDAVTERLVKALQKDDWGARRAALSSLGAFAPMVRSPEEVAAGLWPLARGSDPPTARAARQVLAALHPFLPEDRRHEIIALLLEWSEDPRWTEVPRILAAAAPSMTPEQRSVALDHLLRRTSPGTAASATEADSPVHALAEFAAGAGRRSSVRRLLTCLALGQEEGLEALGDHGPAPSLEEWATIGEVIAEHLRGTARSRELALRACRTLCARLPEPEAERVLEPLLRLFWGSSSTDESWRAGLAIRALAPQLKGKHRAEAQRAIERSSHL
jgi:hypothetical protein